MKHDKDESVEGIYFFPVMRCGGAERLRQGREKLPCPWVEGDRPWPHLTSHSIDVVLRDQLFNVNDSVLTAGYEKNTYSVRRHRQASKHVNGSSYTLKHLALPAVNHLYRSPCKNSIFSIAEYLSLFYTIKKRASMTRTTW